jgi:pantoate kinase
MAKQFDPTEFGINPELFKENKFEEILKQLAEAYTRDPTVLLAGAKKMAERIKKKVIGGSVNREELLSEAQEFLKLFKEHPQFKDIMEKASGFMGPGGLADLLGGSANAGEPSERRRAVQERLRKKLAARNAATAAGGAGSKK